MTGGENFPKQVSDDPQENLRIENEILKLKMQAESGAFFGGEGGIPPAMEEAWKDVKYVRVYDQIGRPVFRPENELSNEEIKTETERLTAVMNKKEVFLDISGEYEPRLIYRFITEELFDHETDDMQLPGWSKNFSYEEFHPNHAMDIEKTAKDFLRDWFKKKFTEYSLQFNKKLMNGEGKAYTRDEVKNKLNTCLSFYEKFSTEKYQIDDVNFSGAKKRTKAWGMQKERCNIRRKWKVAVS